MYSDWYMSFGVGGNPRMESWPNRMAYNCLKVAMIYQASLGGHEIGVGAMACAMRLMDRVYADMSRLVKYDLAFGEEQARLQKVMACLRKARQPVSHSKVMRNCDLSATDMKTAIETLAQRGDIVVLPEGRGKVYQWVGQD